MPPARRLQEQSPSISQGPRLGQAKTNFYTLTRTYRGATRKIRRYM